MEDTQLNCDHCNITFASPQGLGAHRAAVARGGPKMVNVVCTICNRSFLKRAKARAAKKHYCPDCKGTSERTCSVCSSAITRWNSQFRITESHGGRLYCSAACKAIAQRKPWNGLSRSQLKRRWIDEFGEPSCNRCGHDKIWNIRIHHKIYVVDGGSHEPENLEPLCLNCHGTEHYERKDTD